MVVVNVSSFVVTQFAVPGFTGWMTSLVVVVLDSFTGLFALEHGVCMVSVIDEVSPVSRFSNVVVILELVQQLTLSG